MSNKKIRQIIPFILLGLGLILIAVSGFHILDGASAQNDLSTVPVRVDFPAPELTLTDLNGETRSLVDYRGQVILVNLWATWCPPCKEEMPTLQAFHDKYNDDGFAVIAINDGDPSPDVLQFVQDYKLTFPVWLDPTYIATEDAFKTLNLPSSFVIDRNGIVRLQWVGEVDRKILEEVVTPIIKERQ
ncbi:MAG TPA: TlpA disulfide reductase family protein [Anaerolineales bacterium]|nr:TlpA disulfide reductase family protein [Anaerolineales bacterium]